MSAMRQRIIAGALAILASLPALAGQRIESQYYPGPNLDLQSRWLLAAPQRLRAEPALRSVYVAESPFTEMRLLVPPSWVGKRARIYLLVPGQVIGMSGQAGFEAEWRTQGVFLAGKSRPGDRVLFYEGTVRGTPLRDFIAYTFKVDARYASGPVRFEPVYEIEEF